MSDPKKKNASLQDAELTMARARLEREKFFAETHWYAVYVQPQHEFQINDYLLGIEEQTKKTRRGKAKREDLDIKIDPAKVKMQCYVPVVRKRIKYSDRYVWKEKVQTPGLIFVRCSLNERDYLFHSYISEYVTGFLNDHDKHRPVPIPDAQMEVFMKLVEAEYLVAVDRPSFSVGQKVLILEGPMAGHVAELVGLQETISKQEHETDRLGNVILDNEGNPVPKHKTLLRIRLNAMLEATFEIDATKVAVAPDNATDFVAQD